MEAGCLMMTDFYQSAECRKMFVEWLTPNKMGTNTEVLRTAQQHSVGLVPRLVTFLPPDIFCEYIHNELWNSQVRFDALIDHLMVVMQGEFQSDADYHVAATEWLEDADRDMAADWCERSWEARERF